MATGAVTAGWGTMLFGLLSMALLVDLPVYFFSRFTTRPKPTEYPVDSSLAVLREQCARGEIDDEEYERRRERLTANR